MYVLLANNSNLSVSSRHGQGVYCVYCLPLRTGIHASSRDNGNMYDGINTVAIFSSQSICVSDALLYLTCDIAHVAMVSQFM